MPPEDFRRRLVFPATHPALAGHFPQAPVVPAVVLLDAIAEAARAAFGLGVLREITFAKFVAPLPPEREVELRLSLQAPGRVVFALAAAGQTIGRGEAGFAP